jgi:hypothetical protein
MNEWASSLYAEDIVGGLLPMTEIFEVSGNAEKRQSDCDRHRDYASDQRTIRTGILAGLRGRTAEALMTSHNIAEVWHHGVADGHEAKSRGWANNAESVAWLKSRLENLVFTAEKKIKAVQRSKIPEEAKITKIASIVAEAREDAIYLSSEAVESILDSMSRLLTETGQDKSPSDIIKGLDNKYKLDTPHSDPGEFGDWKRAVKTASNHGDTGKTNNADPGKVVEAGYGKAGQPGSSAAAGSGYGVPDAPAVSAAGGGADGGSLVGALGPGAGSAGSSVGAPVGGQGFAPAARVLSPNGLAGDFSSGLSSGLPASQTSALTAGSAGGPVGGAGYVGPPPISLSPPVSQSGVSAAPVVSAPSEASSPVVAPMQAAPPAPVAPAPAVQGPLPAYGSDLRAPSVGGPAAAGGLAAPGASTFSSGGAAAPVAGAGSGLGQPAVVRASVSPVGQVGSGGVAATGATVAAAAETVEEQRRCDELLNAVAVQEPRIRWAAGTQADGSIMLVTDLAGGWIPPHVRLPAGAQIIQPDAARWGPRDSVGAMLGAPADCVYSPGQLTSPATAVELSDWARQVDPVDDIGWILRKAVDWRDGLPRLAFIMAKAWARSTGVRPIEVNALRDHMAGVRADVLASYPDRVDAHEVGNWMLLAAVDAFCADQFMLGNYHFRWFQVASRP